MTIRTNNVASARSGARWLTLMVAFVAVVFAANVLAQAPAAPGGTAAAAPEQELEQLVGRIALYPDDLVAIILPAATNPLQLVQADRFLEKRKTDPKLQLDEKWDDAVKSLLNYPEIVKSMSADLDWTSELGEAVVADQGAVLEAIQVFRRKSQAAGNLKSDPKQTIVIEKEVIKIVPADPQVVYVPQYNPTTVVVAGAPSPYGYYPAPYPSYYYPYPPGAALATGVIWGAALGAAWSGGHYGANYGGGGNNTINIDNSKNVNRSSTSSQRTTTGGGSGSSQWKSNKQPGQVSGSTGKTQSARAGDAGSRGGAGSAGAGRASAQPAGGGAFGGANSSGRQTQMDSSRGASSRGSSSGAGAGGGARPSASPSMSGGGGRSGASAGGGGGRSSGGFSGGGGGGSRGGGGGGRGGGGGGRR